MKKATPWRMSFAIAHRGAPQLAPENTIAALRSAAQHHAAWVECDIQFSRDRIPVIFHDEKLNRTSNGRGRVRDFSLRELEKLDAGSWFSPTFKNEPIPTLQSWLICADQFNLGLNLEIKPSTKQESILLAESVITHLQQYWPAHSNRIFISSANVFVLQQVHERAKSLPLGWIVEKTVSEKDAMQLMRSGIVSVHQPARIFNANYIDMLHQHELHALAYTVNEPMMAENLKAMGIDGIFTDNAQLFEMK